MKYSLVNRRTEGAVTDGPSWKREASRTWTLFISWMKYYQENIRNNFSYYLLFSQKHVAIFSSNFMLKKPWLMVQNLQYKFLDWKSPPSRVRYSSKIDPFWYLRTSLSATLKCKIILLHQVPVSWRRKSYLECCSWKGWVIYGVVVHVCTCKSGVQGGVAMVNEPFCKGSKVFWSNLIPAKGCYTNHLFIYNAG